MSSTLRHASQSAAARLDVPALLRSRLAPLAPKSLDIRDDSAAHAGHAGAAGGGGHFSLTIVSNAFAGLSRLEGTSGFSAKSPIWYRTRFTRSR